MTRKILITGSEGLVGRALRRALLERGDSVHVLDVRAPEGRGLGDVLDRDDVAAALVGCRGIVHLAAVSRVIDGEHDPGACEATNVRGTRNVLSVASQQVVRPWVIFASSREVYGVPDVLPATEIAPLRPVNVYGRTKVDGERLLEESRSGGVRGATIRLSNVYGSIGDHATRVVPAFVRAAIRGEPLRVDGSDHTFDFTHIDDAIDGIVALIALLDEGGAPPPPIHLVTGTPTTLGQLAALCVSLAGSRSRTVEAPPRSFDVSRFYGDPARARAILGWTPRVTVREGVARLIEAFLEELAVTPAKRTP